MHTCEQQITAYLKTATDLGRGYIKCGGQISELEIKLVQAGLHLGLQVEVHATPAGITIACEQKEHGTLRIHTVRINAFSIDLLSLDAHHRWLDRFSRGRPVGRIARIHNFKLEFPLISRAHFDLSAWRLKQRLYIRNISVMIKLRS